MTKQIYPINPKFSRIWHGGDYNPDQWIRSPEIWDRDMELMERAGCNVMSVGIFAWTALEPEEGVFTFAWLDTIMDKLADNEAYAVLATPSAAKPPWMSRKYPEIRRVSADGMREPHRGRHNHCRTSPVYREKCRIINTKLAERYKDHPALLVWHVSNEYNGGECHCELCYAAFREWLKEKYDNDLDKLNHAWWTGFWASTYNGWDLIEPVDGAIHGLMLDWKRFITDQTIDFYKNEIDPLREHTPDVPVTTNFMGTSTTLDYWAFAREVDVVSDDRYPDWHHNENGDEVPTALLTGVTHDMFRSMKGGRPWMLMESVPSFPSRPHCCKRKRPGMHLLSNLYAVAHGADTVQYFQWRKGRGGAEKFHGAVVDHADNEYTRVFQDVAQVGKTLKKLDPLVGTVSNASVAIVNDFQNRWAVDMAVGLGNENENYLQTVCDHYRAFWERGIMVDVIEEDSELSEYALLILPMTYMIRGDFAERLKSFVHKGGTVVMTYWSAVVDQNDLCFLGGCPGNGLRELFGIWDEEMDSVLPFDENFIEPVESNGLQLKKSYKTRQLHSLIHADGADVLATYGRDFYAGRPAVTVNQYGNGQAFFVAARTEQDFLCDFYAALSEQLRLPRALDTDLPDGVTATVRTDGERRFVFVMNFRTETRTVNLGERKYTELLAEQTVDGKVSLPGYGVMVLADT